MGMLWSACATPRPVDCPTTAHVARQTESGGCPSVLGGSMQSGHQLWTAYLAVRER